VRPRVFLEVLERKFANFAVAAKSGAKGILDESCACAERVDCTGELALLAINTHIQTHPLVLCACVVCTRTPISSEYSQMAHRSPSGAKS